MTTTPSLSKTWFDNLITRDPQHLDWSQLAADVQAAPGLLRWCLRPDVKARLADELDAAGLPQHAWWWRAMPQLPDAAGNCWVIVASDAPGTLLRPAFPLPLCWRPGPHDPRVPAALRSLADTIIGLLDRQLSGVTVAAWGLQWAAADGLDRLDLSWLDVEPESGWAALAAGLIIAVRGGRPDRRAWVTGQWDARTGKWSLNPATLPAKLQAASDFGAASLTLPADQLADARQVPGAAPLLQLCALHDCTREKSLSIAVRPYTLACWSRPTPQEPFATRKNYYLDAFHESRDRRAVADFYNECLAQDIASANRRFLSDHCPALAGDSWSHMVTIVSQSFELVQLGYWLLRPRHSLLIHTPDMAPVAEELGAWLESQNVLVDAGPIDDRPEMGVQLAEHVARFAGGVLPARLVLDLTPGKRAMTLALLAAAPTGSRVLCWWHDTAAQERRVQPGREWPLFWEVGETRHLLPLLVRSRPPEYEPGRA